MKSHSSSHLLLFDYSPYQFQNSCEGGGNWTLGGGIPGSPMYETLLTKPVLQSWYKAVCGLRQSAPTQGCVLVYQASNSTSCNNVKWLFDLE